MVNAIRAIGISNWNFLRHRGIIAGATVALALTIVEIVEADTWTAQDMVDTAVQCVLIVLVAFFPRAGAIGIIVQYVLTSFSPHAYVISGLYGLWVALVIVGYFFPVVISFILFLIVPMTLAASLFLYPSDGLSSEGEIGLSLFFFGFYFLGLIFRQREIKQTVQNEIARTRQIEQENSRLKRDNALAIELHDSLAGGLSSIALKSDMRKDDDKDFEEIHSNSLVLLNEVHEILDVLAQPESDTIVNRQQESISHMATTLNNFLHSQGFDGSINVDVRENKLNPEVVSFVNDLLSELVKNVEYHASPSLGEYAISVHIEEKAICIRATNPVPVKNQARNDSQRFCAGKGLKLYKLRAQSLNGSLSYGTSDGSWFVLAVLPIEN
ncbi:MAG: hypothetical protein LKJ47_03100 [Bifidobacteriaceae bacterium]|nr:hypothetical protein [Bifidobacteriaceae bacterium]